MEKLVWIGTALFITNLIFHLQKAIQVKEFCKHHWIVAYIKSFTLTTAKNLKKKMTSSLHQIFYIGHCKQWNTAFCKDNLIWNSITKWYMWFTCSDVNILKASIVRNRKSGGIESCSVVFSCEIKLQELRNCHQKISLDNIFMLRCFF